MPVLNAWISAIASRMSSIRRRHFLDDTYGLGQDSIANARLETLRRAEIDPATKQTLQVTLEFQEPEQSDRSVELDQQVHVTILTRFIARDRTKECETRHAESRVQTSLLGLQH
jgi:hypothetical protein